MRIVFLGLPLAALLLHADGHKVALAGLRSSLSRGSRRLRRFLGLDGVWLDPHLQWEAFRQSMERSAPDLLVSWFFPRRIPLAVIQTARLGGIGVHPSLLPRYRGPDPFFAAIDNGDEITGVTVHRLGELYDTGAILEQRTVRIDRSWNAWQLARRLDSPSLEALRAVVGLAAAGDRLTGVAQREDEASTCTRPNDDARILRWNLPAERIVRRVRALAPHPGAIVATRETELVVTDAEVCGGLPRALEPGEGAIFHETLVIHASDTGVALLSGEHEGVRMDRTAICKLVARGPGNDGNVGPGSSS